MTCCASGTCGRSSGRLILNYGQKKFLGRKPHKRADHHSHFAPWAPPRRAVVPSPSIPYQSASAAGCDRTGQWMLWTCPRTGQTYRAPQPCMRLDCATCYPKTKRRRGARHVERFGGVHALAFTFTLPLELRASCGIEQARALRRLLAIILQEWAQARWSAEIGAVIAFHPTGDRCQRCSAHKGSRAARARAKGRKAGKERNGDSAAVTGSCPRCGAPPAWSPHFDAVVPGVGLRNGREYRLPPVLKIEDLADLKRRWSEAILRVVAVSGIALRSVTVGYLTRGDDTHDPADIVRRPCLQYRHRIGARKVGHCWRYSMRPFPAYAAIGAGLRTPARFGLCGPAAAKGRPGHIPATQLQPGEACACEVCEWRRTVASTPAKTEMPRCQCCYDPAELVPLGVYHRHHWITLGAVDLDPPPDPG